MWFLIIGALGGTVLNELELHSSVQFKGSEAMEYCQFGHRQLALANSPDVQSLCAQTESKQVI